MHLGTHPHYTSHCTTVNYPGVARVHRLQWSCEEPCLLGASLIRMLLGLLMKLSIPSLVSLPLFFSSIILKSDMTLLITWALAVTGNFMYLPQQLCEVSCDPHFTGWDTEAQRDGVASFTSHSFLVHFVSPPGAQPLRCTHLAGVPLYASLPVSPKAHAQS